MGHEIYSNVGSIETTDNANTVSGWCEKLTPTLPPENLTENQRLDWHRDRFGLTDIEPEAVKAAHSVVPSTYEEALANGFIPTHTRRPFTAADFEICRRFLREAADAGSGITGSY